jgi:hypothetical protein
MRQHINLYQRARPIHTQVSARSLLLVCSILLVALLAIWGYGQYAIVRLQHQVDALQQQQQVQANFANITNTLYQEKIDSAALLQQVAQLKQTLQDHQQALALLRHRTPAAQQGFANRLQALAHPHIDGVWLEGIILDGQPGIQSLRGRSLDPALVATYLRALGSEPALTGTRFNDVRILGPKYVEPKDSDAASIVHADTTTPTTDRAITGIRFSVDNRPDTAPTSSAAGSAT